MKKKYSEIHGSNLSREQVEDLRKTETPQNFEELFERETNLKGDRIQTNIPENLIQHIRTVLSKETIQQKFRNLRDRFFGRPDLREINIRGLQGILAQRRVGKEELIRRIKKGKSAVEDAFWRMIDPKLNQNMLVDMGMGKEETTPEELFYRLREGYIDENYGKIPKEPYAEEKNRRELKKLLIQATREMLKQSKSFIHVGESVIIYNNQEGSFTVITPGEARITIDPKKWEVTIQEMNAKGRYKKAKIPPEFWGTTVIRLLSSLEQDQKDSTEKQHTPTVNQWNLNGVTIATTSKEREQIEEIMKRNKTPRDTLRIQAALKGGGRFLILNKSTNPNQLWNLNGLNREQKKSLNSFLREPWPIPVDAVAFNITNGNIQEQLNQILDAYLKKPPPMIKKPH